MLDFDLISRATDDYWYDHEFLEVRHQMERFSPDEWADLERMCVVLPSETQERIAYVLGDIDCTATARILFRLCKSSARDTVLTASEALRGLSYEAVRAGAQSLCPTAHGSSTNELLEWIVTATLRGDV
ncbi:hypothetical protein LRH25_20235 [Ideonella azotifigens]|uniref:HEAT repeat domain-containing protein n=1 Tax=Ideonella azotifigens TaxID=513160 RepID=A0ABP3VBJ1_9BURK|nr:hypothetical protein [Ideonella azotifigens]MCD2342659.1 hypothetical protein [Ideonella azotifigens]